jgi:ABC-type sugar transport system substrate-binding protein
LNITIRLCYDGKIFYRWGANMNRRSGFLLTGYIILIVSAFVIAWFGSQPNPSVGVLTSAARDQQNKHYVAIVPPGMTSPFHVSLAEGAKNEGAKLGWNIEVQATANESDYAGQVTLLQQLLEMGIEAISINSLQAEAIVPVVKTANAKNLPVFIHNSLTPLPNGEITAYIGYDQWRGAAKLGEYTCSLLAKKYHTTPEQATGKVYILLGIEGFHVHRRTQGYIAGLVLCPGVQVVGEQTAEWDREKGANVATAALQQTPDIDVFYGNSDEMGIGAALAAEKLGLKINKDFFALSIDGNNPTLDLIKSGEYTATLGVDPTRIGETVIDTMSKVLNGENVPQFILTPSIVVDATNVDNYIAGKTWTLPIAGSPELDNGLPSDSPDTSAKVFPC